MGQGFAEGGKGVLITCMYYAQTPFLGSAGEESREGG